MLRYELCVYPTTLFETTIANPLNAMENRTDICVIMWVCKNEWWKTILFDSGPSTKDDFHLRWKESCKCNCVLFTRDMTMTCTPCKDGFLSLQQSGQTFICWVMEWWHRLGLIQSLVNSAWWGQSTAVVELTETPDTASVYILYRPMYQCDTWPIRIESDKTTSIYNVSTRVLSKK